MPIITSLLDTDLYKLTMGQVALLRYPDLVVRYDFRCRTPGARLAEVIREGDLRRELEDARALSLTDGELQALRDLRVADRQIFQEPYLAFLKNFRLPEYRLERAEDTYRIEFSGPWPEAIYWETPALAIVDELYYRALLEDIAPPERDAVYAGGVSRLSEKIRRLKERPGVTFSDFGTRRRFSRAWQEEVLRRLSEEMPGQFLGTSNVVMSFRTGRTPVGTMGHEMFMAMSGLARGSDAEIRDSHNRALQVWWDQYGPELSVALADTYGSDFFFREMTGEQAAAWRGLRHDSGDPLAFGEKAIAFYEHHGIDPKEKLLVFSDGLDVEAMLRITDALGGRIRVGFGWGTNLTNDLGLEPLSLVVKLAEADGRRTVKLSDNLAKAVGTPEDVERFKRIFGYTGSTFEACRY
jgi:nicotinate phosphoribosyltransferase